MKQSHAVIIRSLVHTFLSFLLILCFSNFFLCLLVIFDSFLSLLVPAVGPSALCSCKCKNVLSACRRGCQHNIAGYLFQSVCHHIDLWFSISRATWCFSTVEVGLIVVLLERSSGQSTTAHRPSLGIVHTSNAQATELRTAWRLAVQILVRVCTAHGMVWYQDLEALHPCKKECSRHR